MAKQKPKTDPLEAMYGPRVVRAHNAVSMPQRRTHKNMDGTAMLAKLASKHKPKPKW